MKIDDLIDMASKDLDKNWHYADEAKIVLKDIVFTLNEIKKMHQVKLIKPSLRKELAGLIKSLSAERDIELRFYKPFFIWKYRSYFKLKNIYLDLAKDIIYGGNKNEHA